SRRPVAALWKRARLVAERAAGGYVEPGVGAATAYHADYVFPRWAPTLVKVAQIGRHIFYRFPGPWGQPDILRQPYAGGDLRVALAAPAPPAIVVEGDRPVVGVASFADHKIESGRRAPSPDEIARINAALLEMDRRLPAPPPSS
ncbi:MAG: cell wall hydrolase, partial [Caulobacteraceae bacterium]